MWCHFPSSPLLHLFRASFRVLYSLQQIWVTLSYFYGLCTKYVTAGIGMTPTFLVLSACSLCFLFPGINPLEVFRAGCVSWSRAKDLSLYIVVYVVLAKWPLRIISLLCASAAGVWCSAELEFIQNSSLCVLIVPKAPALKEIHHVPGSSLPLHSSPKELPEVQSDFQPGLFCLVLAIDCRLNFGGQAIASRGKTM